MQMVFDSYFPGVGSLNINYDDTTQYPVEEFDPDVVMSARSMKKVQRPGQHPTRQFPEHRLYIIAGHILGTDYDDYWALRQSLIEFLLVPEDFTGYHHMQFQWRPEDATSWWYSDVVVEDYDIPITAYYPSVGPFRIELRAFDPYVRDLGSNSIVSI